MDPNEKQDSSERKNGFETSNLEKICGHFESNITKYVGKSLLNVNLFTASILDFTLSQIPTSWR